MKSIYGIKENDSKGEFQKAFSPNNSASKTDKTENRQFPAILDVAVSRRAVQNERVSIFSYFPPACFHFATISFENKYV